ncbi:MAG: Chemotaxis protein methyltransferase CheR [Gemmatimonadetes bacterium]|nr:Chemotaxis protein methyltransferase CheR [Gemmatimonadota bacterium]
MPSEANAALTAAAPPSRLPPAGRRYALAVLGVATALAVAWLLRAWLGTSVFSPFLAAVVLAAWYGGRGPGLLASALSVPAIDYFLLEPHLSVVITPDGVVKLGVFALSGLLASALSDRLHHARWRAEEAAADARSMAAALHGQAAELQQQAAALQEQATELERQAEEAQGVALELEAQVAESEQLRQELAMTAEESRTSGARLSTILETMTEAVVLVNADGVITFHNAAAVRVLGLTEAPMVGQPADRAPYRLMRADGTPLPEEERPLGRVLRSGTPVQGEEMLLERADGRAVVRVSAVLVRGSGAAEGVVATFEDVTEAREAQAARRANEERFRATFEQAAVGIAHVALDGRWLRVNERLCRILGYGRDELLGMTYQQVTHPDDLAADVEMARRVEAGELSTYTLEKRYLRRDGSPVWISLTVSLAQPAQGEAPYFISVVEDIQARRAAEAAQRESEERFRTLADTAPVLVWMAGPDGGREFFNKPWIDFTGRRADEEAGTAWAAGVHPDDRRRCRAVYGSSIAARRPFRMEYRLRRADGEHRWILDTGVPRFLPDGAFAGFVGSAIDITERREGEEQLRFLADAGSILASSLDYERTLQQVVRLAVPVLADYCVLDLVDGGTVRRVAAAHADPALEATVQRLLAYPPSPDGTGPVAGVLRSARPSLVNGITPELLDRTAQSPEHRAVLDELGPTAYMAVPLLAAGHVLGSLLFVTTGSGRGYDEMELARAEEVARRAALAIENARLYEASVEANRAKADFLAVMSHELRTPLNAILGYTDLFLLGIPAPLPAAVLPQMERVKGAARHLLGMIDEVLTFARLEAGQEEVHLEPGVRCAELVEEAVALVEPLALERSLRFAARCEDPELALDTDPRRVRQILVNLLGNAIKFTDRGSVSLTVRREGEQVAFEVADTGIGIEPGHLARIFDPFWQVEQSRSRRHDGSGLGLAVARQLARLMGGDVAARSEPGAGSAFTLRLPLSLAEPPPAAGPALPA